MKIKQVQLASDEKELLDSAIGYLETIQAMTWANGRGEASAVCIEGPESMIKRTHSDLTFIIDTLCDIRDSETITEMSNEEAEAATAPVAEG